MPRRKAAATTTRGESVDPTVALTTPLGDFEGRKVVGAAVEIPNVAGGLREAMRFAPVEFHLGDEGYAILHYSTKKIRFDPDKDDESCLIRVAVWSADALVLASEIDVGTMFRDQQERIRLAKEQADGIQRLPTDNGHAENPDDLSDEDWEGQ